MATYAGETVVWKTSAKAPDDAQTTLTDADVTQALISIVDTSDGTMLVIDGVMNWDPVDEEWRYVWSTPGVPGRYVAKIRLLGLAFDIWETKKLRTRLTPESL